MREIKTIVSDGVTFPIGIVVSNFNELITSALKKGALDRLTELGFKPEDITLVEVPGAVEIPFVAQLLAKKQKVEVIVALGAVIRGETSHYDYVCDQVSQGCQRVMLDYNIPVIFGVLTTENDEQALARVGGTHGHKGRDAIDCAVSMRFIKQQLQ
ncbi:TPA: 6,7-dimethyl-8-ribityllumazine synthase [Legionella pneumophila]|nr:6,7-dimethyl-8-ribityllumazine synthase [Legionella pneumophila]HAT2065967.1 6,7-dimethyl-8-ribityllumazine synthase [Legionella pneumophila]HAT8591250.1 6,7-dimethyl-8-ribityllumazine synthase [Legionella pneumophila]HAU1576173.1 6,7-dimethyl-8-ribityllumazine synthase [Legionella pneumophila]HAU1680021.1 6,7-dimethyl-8-ribityllumazine synthase [Legionella pneumophila]HAU3699857.1 6,7-dimethyl-8-ribityllumazine synthase [Legionella pneumophila]